MRRRLKVQNPRLGRTHDCPLEKWRHPAVRPIAHAIDGVPAGIGQHDVGGQALTFRAETICEPRAESGPTRLRFAGVHEPDRWLMPVNARVHRADERHVIHYASEMRKEFGDIHSALTVLLKSPGAAEQLFGRAINEAEFYLACVILPASLRQLWFRIEQVDMTGSSVHEKRDHGSGLRAEQRRLGL